MSDFRDIKDAVLTFCGQGTGGTFEALVDISVNGVYRRVLNSGVVPHEERVFTKASVATQATLGFPLYVRKIRSIVDPTTPRFVWTTTPKQFDIDDPGSTDSGTPLQSFPVGVRGVEKYPASNGLLSLVSDDTGDAGANYKVRVTGWNTSGVLISENVTMNGTASVNTVKSYSATLGVERVTKIPASGVSFAGNVTVKDSGANTIAVIPVHWMSPDYQWVQFDPIPATAITYNIRAEMRKPPLVNDGDWPEFDQEYHNMLVYGTTMDLLPGLGKPQVASAHRLTYREMYKEFTGEKNEEPSAVWVFGDVQSHAGNRNRPFPPLIKGVHFGLADGA
jgi:hypothetical protein